MLSEIVMLFLALATAVHTVRSWRSYAGVSRLIRGALLVASTILVLVVVYSWVAAGSAAVHGTVIFRIWLSLGVFSFGEDLLQRLRTLRAVATGERPRIIVDMGVDSAVILACVYFWFVP
jgi:hypothetical protein